MIRKLIPSLPTPFLPLAFFLLLLLHVLLLQPIPVVLALVNNTTDAYITSLIGSAPCPNSNSVTHNPVNGTVYVSCTTGSVSIYSISPNSGPTPFVTNSKCPSPWGMTYDSVHDLVYVACSTTSFISVSMAGAVSSLSNAFTCNQPSDITLDPQTGILYGTCLGTPAGGDAALVVMDPLVGGGYNTRVLVDSLTCVNANHLVLHNRTKEVTVVCNGAAGAQAAVITVGTGGTLFTRLTANQCPGANSIAVDSSSNVIFVSCTTSNQILSVSNTTIKAIANVTAPTSMSYDPITRMLFVTSLTGPISSIDTTSSAINLIATSQQCPQPRSVDYDGVRNLVYSACTSTGTPNAAIAVNITNTANCDAGTSWNTTSLGCHPCVPGSYTATRSQTSCTLCAMGAFNPSFGQTVCQNCTDGFYSTVIGSTTSLNCSAAPPGTYVPSSNRSVAIPCGIGSYNPDPQRSICTFCDAGYYSPLIGQITNPCISCGLGRFNNLTGAGSADACVPCVPGTNAPNTGAAECDPCAAGRFASTVGASDCQNCPANTYSTVIGSTTQNNCLNCPASQPFSLPGASSLKGCQVLACQAGWYPTTNTSLVCDEPCPAGYFCSNAKKIPCWPGSFSSFEGQTSCELCQAGKFSLEMGSNSSSSCIECPQGSFGIVTGQAPTSCNSCPPGTANNNTGSSMKTDCVNCARGTFASVSGSINCEPCALAYYQDKEAQVSCIPCPSNTYSDSLATGAVDASICTKCRAGTSSPPGSVSMSACLQQTCATGMYGDACDRPCTVGHYCDGSTQMKACAAGRYQDETKSSTCKSCAVGRFNVATGSSSADSCTPCPLNTYGALNASIACSACPYGSYTNFTAATNSTDCQYELVVINWYSGKLQAAGQVAFANQQKQQKQQQISGSTAPKSAQASLSLAPTPSYADASLSNSLRLAAFGEDSYLSYASQLRAVDPLAASMSSSFLAIVIAVLVVVASIPLLIYRRLPSAVARNIDQFALAHRLQDGEPVIKKPTKWGAAVSWSFIPIAVLVGLILGSQSNAVVNRALLPSFNQPIAAVGSVQLTLRAFGDTSTDSSATSSVVHMCVNSPLYQSFTTASGFSSTPYIRSLVNPTDSSCAIAIDCISCSLDGVGNWSVVLPWRYQLVEYEIWTTGAEVGQQARMYGILLPNPRVTMLDQESQLQFSLLNAFYKDERNGNDQQQSSNSVTSADDGSTSSSNSSTVSLPPPSVLYASNSGFEIAYQYYSTVTPANVSNITPDSTTTVAFLFNPSSIIYQTSVTSKSSIVQLLFSILASIVSLFSLFAILFKGSSWCMSRLLNWSMVDVSLLAIYNKKEARKSQADSVTGKADVSEGVGPLQVSPIVAANQSWNEFVDASQQYSRSRSTVDEQVGRRPGARSPPISSHPSADAHAHAQTAPPSQGIEMTERMLMQQSRSDQDNAQQTL